MDHPKSSMEDDEQIESRKDDLKASNAEASEELMHDFVLPPGYWYSWRFIGSVTAIVLLGNNLFIGYLMPVSDYRWLFGNIDRGSD